MIHHSRYLENISAQNLLRTLVEFLTVWEPKSGYMWTVEWFDDVDAVAEFTLSPITYIIKKETSSNAGEGPMYVKLTYQNKQLSVLVSPSYDPSTDKNHGPVLSGSHCGTDAIDLVSVFANDGTVFAPSAKVRTAVTLETEFDPAVDRIAKVWLIRKLGPFLNDVGERKNTNIYCWVSMCTAEEGDEPISRMGYYQHMGFGCAGEILVPDPSYSNGPGMFATTGSFANVSDTSRTLGKRQFAGSGFNGDTGEDTKLTATAVLAGAWEGKQTWFLPGNMYGLGRPAFDEDLITDNSNVGFDYTELCKYSPYSGVRVLTPAYEFGMWDNLWRILCRLPLFYTDMAGLYSGDMISQVVDDEVKNYVIFPFIQYRCSGSAESKRGYAIYVPTDEDI